MHYFPASPRIIIILLKLQFQITFTKLAPHFFSLYYRNILFFKIDFQVKTESACRLACEIENEFLCRSFLFKGSPVGTSYNCQLFHLDHKTLPDGPSTFLNAERPLIDDGQRVGTYYENFCESKIFNFYNKVNEY